MPGISGSTKAPLYAQFGVMRFGAFRFGYTSPRAFVSVGGVQRSGAYTVQDLSITKTRSATPNKASFKAMGWEPTTGMDVIVTMGSINRLKRMFGGTVLGTRESGYKDLPSFTADCIDWNWLLDDEPIYGHFTGTYDEIAIELMSGAPTGFSVRQVESGLPTVSGGITFTGVKRSVALNRLAKRGADIGIVQFIDGNKDLYFRVTPSTVYTNPTNIVIGLDSLKAFGVSRDLSQIANRVPFEGGGSNAMTEVAIGETILPLQVAPSWWYGDVGGVVISGPQKITYTTRVEGGGGSLVGPGAQPSSAPTLSLSAGSGVTTGSHVITVVFVTAAGRSLPSPTATIVVGLVSAPSSAVTAGTPTTGGSMNAGSHRYYSVFRTAAGSTTAGPVSNAVTALAAQADPSASGGSAGYGNYPTEGDLVVGESYQWIYTHRRISDGAETLPGGAFLGGEVFFSTARHGGINLTANSIAAPSGFELVWYRSNDAGTSYKKVVTFSYDTAAGPLYFRDGSATGTLGSAPPVSNTTAKGTCAVTGIPVSVDSLVTHVDLYREFNAAGAGTAKLAFSVTNGTTSGSDSIANASLGATVPGTNTAAAGQIAASAIPIGGSGTTDRELYMSPAGGGARKRALALGNNTATTGTITMSDATLAGEMAEPTADTSGLSQPAGQVNPGSTSLLVAGTAPFRSAGGWAFTGTQVIRYTGFSGSSLTGIPASGIGSIQQAITYNTVIAAAPSLAGIPASGAGSILYTIQKGDSVNLFVTVEDTDAQAGLQALMGAAAPVVRECPPLQDRRLNRDEAIARATAFLTQRAYPSVSVGPYRSKDTNNEPGLEVNIAIAGSPTTVNDVFKIQSVTISNFTNSIPPDYTVTASDELFEVADILSREP